MSAPAPQPPVDRLRTIGSALVVGLAWSLPVSLFGMQAFAISGGLLLLAWILYERGRSWRSTPLDRPIGLWLACVGLSLLLAPRPPTSLTSATSFWVVAAYFVSFWLLGSRTSLRRALAGMLALAGAAAAFGVYQSLTGDYPAGEWLHPQFERLLEPAPGQPGWYGAVGLFFSRLTFAHVLLFPLCLALGLALERIGLRVRIALLLGAGLIAAGIAATWTRAAWLAGVACCAVLVVSRLRAGWRRRLGLAGLGLAVLAALVALPQVRGRLADSFAGKKDWGRLAIWHAALDLTAERPLTGIGYGNFQRDAAAPVEQRRAEVGAEKFRGTLAWAHSNPLTFLAETGALGLFAFCWLFVAYFAAAARGLRRVEADPLLRGFVRGSMAAVAACLLTGLFHDTFFDGEVVFCLWFVMGASLAAGRLAGGDGEGA